MSDTTTALSLRDRILAAEDRGTESVDVPEWGVTVECRSMSGRERARMLRGCTVDGETDLELLYPAILIATVHDPETGAKVFTDDDYDALNVKSAAALERVAKVAMRLSGLDGQAVDQAGNAS